MQRLMPYNIGIKVPIFSLTSKKKSSWFMDRFSPYSGYYQDSANATVFILHR